MEERMLEAADGASGYAAWEAICRTFYTYATENPGVFSAMLWYNKYRDDETQKVTERLFSLAFRSRPHWVFLRKAGKGLWAKKSPIKGMTPEEISGRMGIPLKAVKAYMR